MKKRGGFTLIEVLVAIVLLVVICSIVYASFVSVLNVTDLAREQTEELHLRQFLTRSLTTSFSTLFCDESLQDSQYALQTVIDKQSNSAVIRFVSSAPMMGNRGMPGALKQVQYTFPATFDSLLNFSLNDTKAQKESALQASESPLEGMAAGSDTRSQESRLFEDEKSPQKKKNTDKKKTTRPPRNDAKDEDPESEEPQASTSWNAPIKRIEFTFFDGANWVSEWDSTEMGRMPWCVHIRIDLPYGENTNEKTELDPKWKEGADIDLIIPIPVGAGMTTDAFTWAEATESLLNQQQNAANPSVTPGKTVTGKDTSSKTTGES